MLILLILAILTLVAIGLFKSDGPGEVSGKTFAGVCVGGIAAFIALGCVVGWSEANIGVDADIARYEQVRNAVATCTPGDASFSGILNDALGWNKHIVVSRYWVDSPWVGIFYNRRIANLELIKMPREGNK